MVTPSSASVALPTVAEPLPPVPDAVTASTASASGPSRPAAEHPTGRVARPDAGGGWRTAAREFVVIAAGALAALGAQAWWQGRQDREREQAYLRQLLVDTRENAHRLAHAIATDSTTRDALTHLVVRLYDPAGPPSADTVLAALSGTVFSASDFQPIAGTYGALIATGDLRLIRDDSLRARLVAYAGRLDYEDGNLAFYREQAFSDPGRLARSLPFLQFVLVPNAPAPRPEAVSVAALRDDRELRGTLFALQAANMNRLSHLRLLHRETVRLRAALERQLGQPAEATPAEATPAEDAPAEDAPAGGRPADGRPATSR